MQESAFAHTKWRKTSQALMPISHAGSSSHYDLYPAFPIESNQIRLGFDPLAEFVAAYPVVIIDGYAGVFWGHFQKGLDEALAALGVAPIWINVETALRPEPEIMQLITPFLNGDDPLFGTRFTGHLRDFFDPTQLQGFSPNPDAKLTIVYGCGAALVGWDAPVVYVDLPKNEIQFRARAGMVTTLATSNALTAKAAYKRCYFVDWVALNQHKADCLDRIALIVDGQTPETPRLMKGDVFRASLREMAHTYVRARPWLEAGTWGGQWLKKLIPELPQEEVNYAWSFELISPENGIVFESDGMLLEVAFDWLMLAHAEEVLGPEHAQRFGASFPIRFDYLDTIEGGNLSLQCHPRPDYMRQHFGESYTQDETYYIFECTPDAQVYLGFHDDIDASTFEYTLQDSSIRKTPVDVTRFVQTHPARKHDLFLIPSGTVHCSGVGNLVLEISATPYIFTFKMYDWLRVDLEGLPRPLNLRRAFDNLRYDLKGERAVQELLSRPTLLEQGDDWQIIHYPTHPEHFYDVHRLDFEHEISIPVEGTCHVLCIVEGQQVELVSGGKRAVFHYAETFIVPAAAERYILRNLGSIPVKIVKAFLKPTGANYA